ncbi:GNAT family N-acetyltransferase [Flammeovirgaceae bacterium SG7u.111]|nr:GNAT family N-acetyltransferase [Flammeovirgaceae bacterium SG7u.132]WPO38172.1 GNAT family N-acetyltransferase [Flammeovirgaceae bacterium SG7u.111]
MSRKTTFALAKKNNIPELLEMMEEFYAIDSYPFDPDKASRLIEELIATPALGRLWLTFQGEELVGYIVLAFGFSFEYAGRDAMIDEFFIKEPARGKGLGKATLEYVELQAKAVGIILSTWK